MKLSRLDTTLTDKAIYFVEDIMDRALANYVVLGETAKQMMDNPDSSPEGVLEFGILKKDYTKYAQGVLKTYLPKDAVFTERKITFEVNGSQVIIRILNKKHGVLLNPDTIHFKVAVFQIPNPFEGYWKIKNFVK